MNYFKAFQSSFEKIKAGIGRAQLVAARCDCMCRCANCGTCGCSCICTGGKCSCRGVREDYGKGALLKEFLTV